MSTDYSSITTFEQLKTAQIELKYKIELKEIELADRYGALKSYFSPLTVLSRIVSRLYSLRFLGKYMATAYDYIRDMAIKLRDAWKNRKAATMAAEKTEAEEDNATGENTAPEENK